MNYDQFAAEWLGKRVDYDGVYQYQCVDLIKQYVDELYGIKSGAFGNAIDYWTNVQNPMTQWFNRIAGSNVMKGDIIILTGGEYGHIGVATGRSDATNVEMLEQNGSTGNGQGTGGDVIRTRFVPRTRVAGLLRKKGTMMESEKKRLDLFNRMKKLSEGILLVEAKLPKVEVWDLETEPNWKSRFTYTQGQKFEICAFIDTNGTRYYLQANDILNGKIWGVNVKDINILGNPASAVNKAVVVDYITKKLA